MLVTDIVDEVERQGVEHVVITGGEPMLFDATVDLARLCKERGLTITIETAGTIYRDLPCDLMSISPKLANSTPADPIWHIRHKETRTNIGALRQLTEKYPYQLKFVVGDDIETDIAEIESLLRQIGGAVRSRVLLMPEGTDGPTIHARARALVEPVLKRNWRLTPRMHIDIFGNTKGT